MRIAVTSQNFRTVTGHAGRARRFLIYNVQPGAAPVEVGRLDLPKELAMHDWHGSGAHPLDGVDVLLTEGFGEGFAQRLARRGITVALASNSDPLQAVTAYLAATPAEADAARQATCGCGHGHHHAHGHQHAHGTGSGLGRGHRGVEILDAGEAPEAGSRG